MLLSDMEALGIRKLFPTGDLGFVLGYMPNLVPKREKIPDLTMEEVQVAKRVAAGFGVEFAVPIMAALLSHEPRNWQRSGSEGARKEVKIIAGILDDAEMEDYSAVDNIMKDVVFTTGYVEIELLILLLRMLTEYRRKKGNEG